MAASARAVMALSPVRCASASRFSAATDVAAGSAPSYCSLRRSSTDGSSPVVLNQPPSTGSANSSSSRRCSVERPLEPRRIAGGLEQLQQPAGQVGVVLGVAGDGGVLPAVAAQQRLGRRRPTAATLRKPAARPASAIATWTRRPGCGRPARDGADHQAVPGGQHLVVEVRPRAAEPRGEQHLARRRQLGAQRPARCGPWPRPRPPASCAV